MNDRKIDALDKALALVLWAKDENDDDDVAVFKGQMIEKNGMYFLQRDNNVTIEIREEWLPKIEQIPEELKEILLNCDYQLPLTVGNIENDSGISERLGLKWPR